MFKLPDFMRIDPTDLNAESIRRLSTFGKPQEDFIMGAVPVSYTHLTLPTIA